MTAPAGTVFRFVKCVNGHFVFTIPKVCLADPTTEEVIEALKDDDVWPQDVAERFPGLNVEGIRKLAMGLAEGLCGDCKGHGSTGPDPNGNPVPCSSCSGTGAI